MRFVKVYTQRWGLCIVFARLLCLSEFFEEIYLMFHFADERPRCCTVVCIRM